MSNHDLIRLKRFISSFPTKLCIWLFFKTIFSAPYICQKFNVTENLKNFWELNIAYICCRLLNFDLQDDEYLASLQADQEKELKALQEAELHRLEETAAREAALEKQKQQEEERRKKQIEEEVSFCHM